MSPFDSFRSLIKQGIFLVADGATGTNLQACGLPQGSPSDIWVLENPKEVLALHQKFITAGSNIILTDTFGAKEIQLKKAGLGEKAEELNTRAVELARQAAEGHDVFVAGSIGPIGELLQPYGTLSAEEAAAQYSAQAQTLIKAGVDLLVVETQYDLAEAKTALAAVRARSADIPLVCSFSYDRGVRTMMGVKPGQMAAELAQSGADLLGINCGRSVEENMKNLAELRAATSLPIWFKPNAGMPQSDGMGGTSYQSTPEQVGTQVSSWLQAGAAVVGGCCGTTPEHIAAIAQAVASYKPSQA